MELIEDLRQQNKIGDLLIVAPEGRRSFYINSADGKVRYSDFFLREFMPYIESKYRIAHRPGEPRHHGSLHGRIRRVAVRLRVS